VQSALASLEGIDTSDVVIDYTAKTATVNTADSECSTDDLIAAFEGTRFTAVAN
jgi:copper chaperone CopZ